VTPVTRVEPSARAAQRATAPENHALGDELLGGRVELRVVVLVVGAYERVRELVKQRLSDLMRDTLHRIVRARDLEGASTSIRIVRSSLARRDLGLAEPPLVGS